MNKVLYLKVPNQIKQLHKSIKGMKLYKGIWGSFSLSDYTTNFDLSLIIMPESSWSESQEQIKTLEKKTKLVVLSDSQDVLELSDAIIDNNMTLITKAGRYDLKKSPKDLYLWSLSESIVTKCNKCSSLTNNSAYTCYTCGSENVEISKAINHLND